MTVPCGRSAFSARSQAVGVGAGLEDDVGAAAVVAVPAALGLRQASSSGRASKPRRPAMARRQSEGSATRTSAPARRAKSAVRRPTVPAPQTTTGRPAMPAPSGRPGGRAPRRRRGGCRWRQIGPICATKMPRIGSRSAGSGTSSSCAGLAVWPVLWPKVVGDDVAGGEAGGGGGDDLGDLHVADERHRVAGRGLAGCEDAAAVVPARVQVGVGALEEGELGAGGEAGEAAGRAGPRRDRRGPRGTRRRTARRARSTPSERTVRSASGDTGALGSGGAKRGLRVGPQPLHPDGRPGAGGSRDGERDEVGLERPRHRARGCGSPRPRPRRGRRGPRATPGRRRRRATGRPRPTSTIRSWSVSSSASPSAKTWRPTRWLQRRRQVAERLAMAPEAKRRAAVEAVATSRPGKSSRGRAAASPKTSVTSPARKRARSMIWVACSTIWPPERSSRCHQSGGGVWSSQ